MRYALRRLVRDAHNITPFTVARDSRSRSAWPPVAPATAPHARAGASTAPTCCAWARMAGALNFLDCRLSTVCVRDWLAILSVRQLRRCGVAQARPPRALCLAVLSDRLSDCRDVGATAPCVCVGMCMWTEGDGGGDSAGCGVSWTWTLHPPRIHVGPARLCSPRWLQTVRRGCRCCTG